MSFLNPFILFGLFAASLPILIHLFTRTKSRTIPFSTIDFLKELQNQQLRRIKLRQILLLILRTLIIIFLVLAFARPTLKGALSDLTTPNAKTSMAIILDNSVSMTAQHEGKSLFVLAKEKVGEITNLFHPGDEAFILTTTDTTSELLRRPYHDRDILNKAVADVRLNYRKTDISSALEFASRLLGKSSNVNKEIYLFSDMQKTGFTADSVVIAHDIRLFGIPIVARSVSNLAVENLQLTSTILQRGKVAQAAVTIINTGDQDIDNALVQLFVNDKRVAQLVMHLDAGATKSDLFRFTLEQTGFSRARVTLEDDDILGDNERSISFYVPENLNVGLAGFRPSDTFYASLVLDPKGMGTGFHTVVTIPLADLRYASFSEIDVLLLSNIPSFDQQSADKVRQFVEDGGGLLLVLGENIDIRAYNSILVEALALPRLVDIIGSVEKEKSDFTLGTTDLTHPIFMGVFDNQDAEITNPRFHFAIKMAESADIDPILEYSNGDPLLFEKKLGLGTILVMTTGFDVQLSDITHRTIFAPLITRMVGYAGSARTIRESSLTVGDEIRQKISPQDVNKTLEMLHPGEKFDRLKPGMTAAGAWIHYSQTELPGIYELLADGNVLNVWAVQLDPLESDRRIVDLRMLEKNYAATLLKDKSIVEDFVVSRRFGTELWRYFALVAFLLLIVEMLMYREKGEVPVEKKI